MGSQKKAGRLLLSLVLLAGCGVNRGSVAADFYKYDFVRARESVRKGARGSHDGDTVLANVRLGLSSLADGDLHEANESLGLVYKLMESGKVNTASRIAAATIILDDIKIWKGEPFEQAMAYYGYAISRALAGDWENARASIRGSLRKLQDFSKAFSKKNKAGKSVAGNPTSEDLAKRAAQADSGKKKTDFLKSGGTWVESDFALGYLIQGIAEHQIGASGKGLELAVARRPHLKPLVNRIRRGDYNCILIVDYGRGPFKYRYGRDNVFTDWKRTERLAATDLVLSLNGSKLSAYTRPVHDMVLMAANHRWKNTENARDAKSKLGTALLHGGLATAALSSDRSTSSAGAVVALVGLLMKASSGADIRHNELLPHATYVIPLKLPASKKRVQSLTVTVPNDPSSTFVVPRVRPGSSKKPTVIYLRLFPSAKPPAYLKSDKLYYRNDHVPPRAGDYPYILGGNCVARPSPAALKAYHAGGYLKGLSLDDLVELYRQEGIQFNSGPNAEGKWSSREFRHVLEGGNVLYTPHPYTVGYKRVMYVPKAPYSPRSKRVRAIAEQIRNQQMAKARRAP